MFPPGVCPPPVNPGSGRPVAFIRDDYGGVVGPGIAVHRIGITVETCLQVLEIRRGVADGPFVRIRAQSVPGLLEGAVVGPEIQPVSGTRESEAVGCRVPRILEVVLTELLGRGHIQRPDIHVGDFPHGIVEDLSAGMGRKELIITWNLQIADERVLQFPDDGMGLPVFQRCPEPDHRTLRPDFQAQGEGLAAHAVVLQEDRVCLFCDSGLFIGPGNLDFLLLRRVVIQSPEGLSAGIVPSVHGQFLQPSVCVDFHFRLRQSAPVAQHEPADVVVQGPVLRLGRLGQLRESIGTGIEGDGFLPVETGLLVFLHIAADPVLQGGDVFPGEDQFPFPVRAQPPAGHLVGDSRILHFQLHAAQTGLPDGRDGLFERMPSFVPEVPVPIGLHPGLVDAQLFPMPVSRSQVIGNPIQPLAVSVAVFR